MLVRAMRLRKGYSNNALVPLVATLHPLPLPWLSHLQSEATFLTHLMVTSDSQSRRATCGQADAAYHATGMKAAAARLAVHRSV